MSGKIKRKNIERKKDERKKNMQEEKKKRNTWVWECNIRLILFFSFSPLHLNDIFDKFANNLFTFR